MTHDPLPAGVLERVLAAVRSRNPVDEREAESLERFEREVVSLPAPFDEQAGPVHVTGSGLVIGRRGIALHRHKRLGIWLQPGGHIEHGETPWDGARREAVEELGLPVVHPANGPVLAHVDVHAGAKPTCALHLDLRYLLLAPALDPAPPEGESPDARWFTLDEAMAVADAGLIGALRALAVAPVPVDDLP